MNYQIILDEAKLLDFINTFLPGLEKNEKFYVCLFARSKYQDASSENKLTHISSDKSQLKRFSATKETLYYKIKQLECKVGSYVQYKSSKNHIPIPQETLALYITPNPRSERKAMLGSLKKFAELICNGENIVNASNFAMSELQRSKSRTIFVDFDFDNINYELFLKDFERILAKDSYSILKTRGGFHLLIKADMQVKNSKWYSEIKSLSENIDQSGDCMIPVPGCTQGNFTPYFIEL